MTLADILIRFADGNDIEWILPLVPRLHEFGPPPWRTKEEMDAGETAVVRAAITHPTADSAMLVARAAGDATPLGFIHMVTVTDYFTGEHHGHVSVLVVSPAGEGRGVGRKLMDAGEEWARRRGYRLVSLGVFEGNKRARDLYDRLGYRVDTLKLMKVLDPSSD